MTAEPSEEVGSVGEEATKLLDALQGWARDAGSEHLGAAAGAASAAAGAAARAASAAGHADGQHGQGQHATGQHATGQHTTDQHGTGQQATAGDCRYCPLCAVARATPPEVRAHLAAAAGSLVQAVASLLATSPERAGSGPEAEPPTDPGAHDRGRPGSRPDAEPGSWD